MSGKLGQFWQKITGREQTADVSGVPKRFVSLFQEHGIEVAQIPRLVPSLRLDDLSTPQNLLSALTPEIIDQVANLFGIRSQWLEGVDDEIYEYLGTYNEPAELLKHLSKVSRMPEGRRSFPLRVLSTKKCLDRTQDEHQVLVPVLVEPITELGDKVIYRYFVYRDGFDWNHSKARLELKAIARIIFTRLGTPIPLFETSENDIEEVLAGRKAPGGLMRGAPVTNPSLEDYALSSKESAVAKETQELDDVLGYIEAHGLKDFSFDDDTAEEAPITSLEASEAMEISESTGQAQQRRQGQNDLWAPLLHASQAIWAQDSQLPIAEVVRRLKRMRHLKASAYTDSAIHKRIKPLAPDGIRGKPGRKPKQSSPLMPELIQQQLDK